MPALVIGLLAPLVLLVLLLLMERIEKGLSAPTLADHVLALLEDAQPDEVEELVVHGVGPALDRYWRRRRMASLVPGLAP